MASKQHLLDTRARLTRERAALLDWLRRLRQGGANDQVTIQENNLLEIERQLAEVDRQMAQS